ncbi:penicillin-binding protein 1C [Phenylobacterium montanum]|uniref:peptidoglycan glycosyltransferase n=1 Tax=Phenylobacterium montanum TaxID=2823693 RepID=A0A975FXC2_9CAUL|nr:penicillin-binding protein 1C [Caulobacter sp. S6]QUD87025.1 penicillin-binding protein 1C [Caulobacter sp. S6]
MIRRLVIGLIALLSLETTLLALDLAFPPDLSRAERSSAVVLDHDGGWLRALPVERGRWRIRADLDRTDPRFLKRVVAVEDARFYAHPGVDPVSLVRAVGAAAVTGHVRSGASTLTMQTARLLTPHRRSVVGKLMEMARAVQLEARFSKRQILALYLTLAPYGGNLEGVRAASLAYFGHGPESLTDGEQALLIALPQAPEARRPDRRPEGARAARRRVLALLAHHDVLTQAEAEEAAGEPVPGRTPFPALAWQVSGELARAAPRGQASVVSTLDASLQTRLEALAARTAAAQGPDATAALIVVEIRTRAVRAAVASAGRDRPGGWIDMTRALRSPGSALKPFIYAFAFDDGLAAPDTLIQDQPKRFADYQPENFDRTFHGPVTAREALNYSLNIPAVETLDRIGPEAFQSRLEATGVKLVRPEAGFADPGLSLALGGEGISLRDMATLYAALGDDGLAKPLAFTEAEATQRPKQAGMRLVRAETARQILDILRETPTPKGRAPSALTQGAAHMAYKTGTSYGFRDAVAAGVVGGYALVAWTGRADGGARGGLTGRDAALPLLFDAADVLSAPDGAAHPIAPKQAPLALQKLQQASDGPRLIFPPDGAVVQADGLGPKSRGLVLAAAGQRLTWYVDGAEQPADQASGQVVWRPAAAGFYHLQVVDDQGRAVTARVRVKGE